MRKALSLLLTLCAPTVVNGADLESAKSGRPNVLFIAVDDLRPRLGCYGVEGIVSPNIDRLAAGGIVFERSYCMVPTCGASRSSLMTGIRPSRGRFVNYLARADEDAPGITTLNTHFKRSGYHTISLGKVFHWPEDNAAGWSEPPWRPKAPGYRDPENVRTHRRRSAESRPEKKRRGPPYEAADVEDEAYGDGLIAERAIEDLRRLAQRDEPFFLAVGFFKPHLPFVAPKRYWDLYDREEIALPRTYHRPRDAPDVAIHNFGELRAYAGVPESGPLPDELARTLIHGYSACVSYTDAQVGRLLDELDRLGLAENTIVVLWGDHGWNLGEHTLWCKHCTFETSMRAPLIVRAPGIAGGRTTRGLTEFIDLYPSLCELAGLPKPGHLEGTSFVPLLADPSRPWKDAAIGRYRSGDTIRTDRYRFTEYTSPRGELIARMLYDHESDPEEDINISERPENDDLARELAGELRRRKGVDFGPELRFSLHEIGKAGDKLGQTSLADIDRDGDLDFVSGARGGEVQWWEHRGADEWVRHAIGGNSPTDVGGVAFDVDGDGWIDQCSGGAWWRNTGEPWRGAFQRFENGAIGTHDNRIADVDGDGRLDLVSMRDVKGVFWYRIPDDPTQRWTEHRVGDARHSGLAPADIDGDGDVDLVVGNWWYENSDGTGGRWTRHETIPFEGTRYNEQGMATQNRAGDLDGDGDLDLAITDGETPDARAAWIENLDGKGRSWRAHELAKGRGALHSLAIADFDGDGDLDIFTCEMNIGGSGRWFIYAGDGKGRFRERMIHEGVPGHESVAGDVDGDGDIDICSKPWNGDRHIYLENRLITGRPRRRPRLVVTTDIGGDPDDLQSLIRLLVTSNELAIDGLIASASGTPDELDRHVVKPHLIRQAVEAYGEVRDNLAKHAEGFPTAASLLDVIKSGNPERGVRNIGEGKDTEGSRWIIDVVDRDDPRPVGIAIWGGSTELAQALWRVRSDRSPREVAGFIAKIRVHAIGHQDDTGPWILREFPSLWYTLDLSQDGDKHISAYRGMWKHGDRSLTTREWLVENVQTGHGALGALYPLRTWSPPENAMKEGDTPSWFAFLENGLNVPPRPDQGGWGGRFRWEEGAFRDAMDTAGDETSRLATVWRWRPAYQNEFAARMDWCVRPVEAANHAPEVAVNASAGRELLFEEVRPGARIELAASAADPDGDGVRFSWSQYREAGTFPGKVELSGAATSTCSFTAPEVERPATVHIVLEAEDDGTPALTSYRRVVVRIVP